jgi:hypothetical protein
MSEHGFGDIELFRYRVDCREESCAVVDSEYLEQAEIGGSGECPSGNTETSSGPDGLP